MAPAESKRHRFYLAARLLDRQLTDVHGVRCGKVDDIELHGVVGGELRLSAILVGPAAWVERLPPWARRLLSPLRSFPTQRIPWEEVVTLANDELRLRGTARELELDHAEETAARLISKVPLS